ncbi:hypothetical protein BaRGS_00017740 [Batillaria attramentaria]|uniref:BTB domain-containing protein n=1 Tax=Batillaria attramentaria TaxID=370345 RepID=A0ABD0KV69_9CAEN
MMDQQNESSSQDKVSSFKQILRKTNFERKIMKHLFEKFDHLYSQRHFCDVTVAIGDETFECHRFMLAAASDFFEASLTSSFYESCSRVVRISHSDVTAESFRMLLDLLYKGKDVVTKETGSDLLKMAVFLQIRFLQDDVEEYLIDNLSPDFCLGIWQLADRYDLRKLAQKAIDMAVAEFEKVSKSEEFLHLPKSLLLIILSSETDMSMDDLFRAVIRWVDEDESRKNHLPELLPFIDFLHLTPGFLGKEALAYRKHPLKDVLFGKFPSAEADLMF